ncbi:53 kDa excretory [Trichuris trichiura]|uniref:53 kDa excretory n=1 Tax=Trichuris trichiura TaxID=36087 RepID=A0A077ZDN5_TRITR|nr:53 kDa excretory [Trichuris trichiura]
MKEHDPAKTSNTESHTSLCVRCQEHSLCPSIDLNQEVHVIFPKASNREPHKERIYSQNQPRSPENEELTRSLTTDFGDIIPRVEHLASNKQKVEWQKEKRDEAAKNVLYSFLKFYFTRAPDYSFDKVIVGAKCNISGDEGAILHMKIKKREDCKKKFIWSTCKPVNATNVYCSWVGFLRGEKHKQMLGAVCYALPEISPEDEMILAQLDLCHEWNYANTGYYRLVLPWQVISWDKDFILYYPPTTDLNHLQFIHGKTKKDEETHVNPERRTGIAGQGIWKNLGENQMDIPIFLRKYNGTRQIMVRIGHEDIKVTGPLAMFYRKPKSKEELSKWNETSAEDYFYALVESSYKEKCTMDKFLADMKGKRKIFKSYFSHPDETDNAWVKARVYMLIIPETSCLYNLNLDASANYLGFQWKTYNDSTLLAVENVVKTVFTDQETQLRVTAGNYFSASRYLAYFVAAAVAVTILLGGLAAIVPSMIALGIPVVLLTLAAIIRAAYLRKWIFLHQPIKMCDK